MPQEFIEIIIILSLLILGYFFGRRAEKNHFESIIKRERWYRSILTFSERLPPIQPEGTDSKLVTGNVVISVDYFKSFVANLKTLVGGRLTTYESLLERGRREAILRMKEEAKRLGATSIFNVKVETASISKGSNQGVGSIEVFAYGTALFPATDLKQKPGISNLRT